MDRLPRDAQNRLVGNVVSTFWLSFAVGEAGVSSVRRFIRWGKRSRRNPGWFRCAICFWRRCNRGNPRCDCVPRSVSHLCVCVPTAPSAPTSSGSSRFHVSTFHDVQRVLNENADPAGMGAALISLAFLQRFAAGFGEFALAPKITAAMEIERVDRRRPFRVWWLRSVGLLAPPRGTDEADSRGSVEGDWVLGVLEEEMGDEEDDDDFAAKKEAGEEKEKEKEEGGWEQRVVTWVDALRAWIDVLPADERTAGRVRAMVRVADHVGFGGKAMRRRSGKLPIGSP